MKLKYKIIDHNPSNSFLVRREELPCLEEHWHFHEEFEIIYFIKSDGIRYIGNTIGSFEEGEIYLIGKNLPHLFLNRKDFNSDTLAPDRVDLIIIQFKQSFIGQDFFKIPEARMINKLLQKSEVGLRYPSRVSSMLHDFFLSITEKSGLPSLIDLLHILHCLSEYETAEQICTTAVNNNYSSFDKDRMTKIIDHLTQNFDRKIELSEISEIANMAPNAFCRFFRERTKKSFSKYLTEIRIGQACRLLIEGNLQISEIAYMTGFNSPSNFNRKFKEVMGDTPSEYMVRFAR